MKTGTDSYENESGKVEQRDDYPWGLLISLNDEAIKRLALSMPKVGDELMLTAKVKVMSTSTHESGDETHNDVSMQITDMAFGPSTLPKTRSAASVMYGPDDDDSGDD
jgi:hypothetical protein